MKTLFLIAICLMLSVGSAFGMSCVQPTPGFQSIDTAPRDGTVIELQADYGIVPHYGLYKWSPEYPNAFETSHFNNDRKAWAPLDPKVAGFYEDESCLRWRPFSGIQATYKQPDGLDDLQRECAALGGHPVNGYCQRKPSWQFW